MPRPILSNILAVTLVATLGIADNSIPNASAAMRSDGVSVVDAAQDANGEPLVPPTPVGQEALSVNESVGLPTAADVAPVVSDGRALLELTGKPATAAKDAPITFAQPAKVGIGERPSSTMSVLILGSDRVRGLDLVAFGFQLTDIPTDAADARIPTVAVSVDYSAFSDLYGASFGSRLQLVRYPACVLTTPKESACVTPTVVASMVNNAEGGVVEGTITLGEPTSREVPPSGGDAAVGPLGGHLGRVAAGIARFGGRWVKAGSSTDDGVYGLTAGFTSAEGSFNVTDLSTAMGWSVGLNSGSFSTTYSIAVPPTGLGTPPSVGLGYSSSAVDGLTGDQNTQGAQTGLGWSLAAGGYIERAYTPCTAEGGSIHDFCWRDDNATIVLNGQSSTLMYESGPMSGTSYWRLRIDPGWRAKRVRGTATAGDNLNETWYVYTPDGTEYRFGARMAGAEALNSVWTVPVYANNTGEPCYGSSPCNQAYRWNLDRVEDRFGNIQSWKYDIEMNYYGAGGAPNAPKSYVRSGRLAEIRYGFRAGTTNYLDRVQFVYANRCASATSNDGCFDTTGTLRYPDTPTDLECTNAAGPCFKYAPSFFTKKVLTGVTTQVRPDGTPNWRTVDSYAIANDWNDPDAGGYQHPLIWMRSIRRTGYTSDSTPTGTAMPDITFNSNNLLDNRADGVTVKYWRLGQIDNELGGRTVVTYGQNNPVTPSTPCVVPTAGWPSNTQDCYPRWTTFGTTVGWGAFNRYYVASVTEYPDAANLSITPVTTAYQYVGDPAYAYETDPYVTSNRTWSEPRGFQEVKVQVGSGTSLSESRHRFFRGMHGDNDGAGGTRSVSVTDYEGTTYTDSFNLRGTEFATATFSGATMATSSSTLFQVVPTSLGSARHDSVKQRTVNYLTDSGSPSAIETRTYYNDYGLPHHIWSRNLGTTTSDDTCTSIKHLTDFPTGNVAAANWETSFEVETVLTAGTYDATAETCGGTEKMRTQTYYDSNSALGAATAVAAPTRVKDAANASGPWRTVDTTFDAAGRPTTVVGPRPGATITNIYGADTLRAGVIDPSGRPITTSWDAGRGLPLAVDDWNYTSIGGDGPDRVTSYSYDGLGRAVKVWYPLDTTPTIEVTYTTTGVSPNRVKQRRQIAAGQWTDSYTYIDGLGRTRETQTASPAGPGRLVSGTEFDARGLAVKSYSNDYDSAAAPGDGIRFAGLITSSAIESETRTAYDALGRVTQTGLFRNDAQYQLNGVNLRTLTAYSGQSTTVTPAVGAATTTHVDLLGRVDRVSESNPAWPDPADTTFGYDVLGRQTSATDEFGNVRSTSYDYRGNVTQYVDPDAGTTALTYNADNTLSSKTNNGTTITYDTDMLGRTTAKKVGGVTLEKFVFDATGQAGLTDYVSSYYLGGEWKIDTTGYDLRGRPNGYTYTVPTATGVPAALVGTYSASSITYRQDDQVSSMVLGAVGSLPSETVTSGYTSLGLPNSLGGSFTFDGLGFSPTYVASTTYSNEGRVASRNLGTQTAIAVGGAGGAPGPAVTRTYGYDVVTGQVTSMVAGSLQSESYSYDAVGNLLSAGHSRGGVALPTDCFSYDARSRLAGSSTTATTCPGSTVVGYSVNEIGNLAAMPGGGGYSYAGPGPHAPTSTSGFQLVWNPDGTLAQKLAPAPASTPLATYTWDAFDRLIATENKTTGATTSMAYWPGGQRALLIDSAGSHLFLGAFGERHTSPAGTPVRDRRYYAAGSVSVAVRENTGSITAGTSALTVLLGDVRASVSTTVTATSTTTVATANNTYGPYGQPVSTGIAATSRGYIGQHTDTSTGLDYLNNRYYDPQLGIFISVDPMVSATGQPYLYANGNPTTLSDPSGLMSMDSIERWIEKTDYFVYRISWKTKGDFNSVTVHNDDWVFEVGGFVGIRKSVCNESTGYGCADDPVWDLPSSHTDVCSTPGNSDLCDANPGESGLGVEEEERIIRQLETMPIDEFYDLAKDSNKIRNSDLAWLDWSNDGCSNSPDGMGGTSFLGPCARHDFSYRNGHAWEDYTGADFFSHDAKIAADDRLEAGIREVCDAGCDWAAAIYGWAVRNFGS